MNLMELKEKLGTTLKADFQVRADEGLPTPQEELNRFLLWGGLPTGALSLVQAVPGLGATSLWMGTAKPLTQKGRWVCWLSPRLSLYPLTLQTQGVNLSFLWAAHHPFEEKTWLWILQELMQAELFSLIGCDLEENNFSSRNWLKLQKQARASRVAVVFLQRKNFVFRSNHFFSLILELTAHELTVHRALHRPTPTPIPWRNLYAHLMPQLAQTGPAGNRGDLPQIQSANSFFPEKNRKFP